VKILPEATIQHLDTGHNVRKHTSHLDRRKTTTHEGVPSQGMRAAHTHVLPSRSLPLTCGHPAFLPDGGHTHTRAPARTQKRVLSAWMGFCPSWAFGQNSIASSFLSWITLWSLSKTVTMGQHVNGWRHARSSNGIKPSRGILRVSFILIVLFMPAPLDIHTYRKPAIILLLPCSPLERRVRRNQNMSI
jgi:hypothetical protein